MPSRKNASVGAALLGPGESPPVAVAVAAAEATASTWCVNWRLQIDGHTYLAGDEIDLDDAAAAPLLAAGVIEQPVLASSDEVPL